MKTNIYKTLLMLLMFLLVSITISCNNNRGKSTGKYQAKQVTETKDSSKCIEIYQNYFNNRQFREAQQNIIECLNQGSNVAHFELAKLLLFQMYWSRKLLMKKDSISIEEIKVFEREIPYQGIYKASNQYILKLPYHSLTPPNSYFVQFGAAAQQFDYLRLIILELETYLSNATDNTTNTSFAKEWLRNLKPLSKEISYNPYMTGFLSQEELFARMAEHLSIIKLINNGVINIK